MKVCDICKGDCDVVTVSIFKNDRVPLLTPDDLCYSCRAAFKDGIMKLRRTLFANPPEPIASKTIVG